MQHGQKIFFLKGGALWINEICLKTQSDITFS